jgi:hypothetical protein
VAGQKGSTVDVAAYLPSLRQSPIGAYGGAAADAIDVAALVDVLTRRPALLAGDGVVSADDDAAAASSGLDPRGSSAADRAALAVVDAAIFALEGQKLRHGYVPAAQALRAHFTTPAEAKDILKAVAAADAHVEVVGPTVSSWRPGPIVADRAVHVVVGSGARLVLDLLAPSVRRLKVELSLLGRHKQGMAAPPAHDDDVYRGLQLLHAGDPQSVVERRRGDADEGCVEADDGEGFVVDCTRLQDDLVDRRLRTLVVPLKRARAVIVGVTDVALVADVMMHLATAGASIKSVQQLSLSRDDDAGVGVGVGVDGNDPFLLDAGSGQLWPGKSEGWSWSTPSSLVWPTAPGIRCDVGAFAAAQALAHARLSVSNASWTAPLRRRVRHGDSGSGLEAIAAISGAG